MLLYIIAVTVTTKLPVPKNAGFGLKGNFAIVPEVVFLLGRVGKDHRVLSATTTIICCSTWYLSIWRYGGVCIRFGSTFAYSHLVKNIRRDALAWRKRRWVVPESSEFCELVNPLISFSSSGSCWKRLPVLTKNFHTSTNIPLETILTECKQIFEYVIEKNEVFNYESENIEDFVHFPYDKL